MWALRFGIVLMFWCMQSMHAHPNLPNQATQATTIALLYIEQDHVLLELEIGQKDQPVFATLFSQEPEKIRQFAERELVLENLDTEEILYPQVLLTDSRLRQYRDPISGEVAIPFRADYVPEKVRFVQLKYPLPANTREIRLLPPRGLDGPKAMMAIVAYHGGVPLNDFGYLNMRETIRLDWQDPWYSRFRSPRLSRYFQSPMSAFLYVEPLEVRLELVIRQRLLQQWLGSSAPSEEKLKEWFTARGILEIEKQQYTLSIDQMQRLNLSLGKIEVLSDSTPVQKNTGMIGVVFVQQREKKPNTVTFRWKDFNERSQNMPVIYNGSTITHQLTEGNSSQTWNIPEDQLDDTQYMVPTPNPQWAISIIVVIASFGITCSLYKLIRQGRNNTWVGLLLFCLVIVFLGSNVFIIHISDPFTKPQPLTELQQKQITEQILVNVYHAFDFRSDDAIYDTLAKTVSGELLKQTYLEIRKTLEVREQSTRAKMKKLELLQLQVESNKSDHGFTAKCRWRIQATVSHWGHLHERTTEYEAQLQIQPIQSAWKMTQFQLIDEQQAKP